jgi:hypothetical protein
MKPEELRTALNRLVRLSFRDGEVVDVLLLGADPAHDRDFDYEVRAIRAEGTPKPKGTAVGATCVASLNDLISWQFLDQTGAAV